MLRKAKYARMQFVPRSIQNIQIPNDHNVEFLNVKNLEVRKVSSKL